MTNFFDIVNLMSADVAIDAFGSVIAYLDPGTGSLVLQILIATFLSATLVVKTYWHNIIGFFRSKTNSTEAESLAIEQKISEKSKPTVEEVERKAA